MTPTPAAKRFISEFIRNFVKLHADPKVAVPGGWMEYQHQAAVEIVTSIVFRQMRLLTLLFARQCGKTELVGISIAAAITLVMLMRLSPGRLHPDLPAPDEVEECYPDGLQVGIYGPGEDTAAVDYKRIQRILRRVIDVAGFKTLVDNTQRMQVVFQQGHEQLPVCYLEIKSAAPASKVESRSWNVILVEEAQDIGHEKLYAEIDPTGAASSATRIRVGTVGDQKCAFDEEIDFNKAQSPENHFEIDYTIPIAQGFRNGAYERYVQIEIAHHGLDSPYFKRKYRLIREYETGMLCSEDQFVLDWSRPRERRWNRSPEQLPDGLVLIGALDVASSNDQSILKLGTSDWRFVNELAPKPIIIERASSAYRDTDYDLQFAQMKSWLADFPLFHKFGVLVIDATGDRGDMVGKFTHAGFNVIPLVFTGGNRITEFDEKTQELKPGSKSALCIDFIEQLGSRSFGYAGLPADPSAPDESYMGSVDFRRALGHPSASEGGQGGESYDGRVTYPPDRQYHDHKHEATHCFRVWVGGASKSLVLQADPKDRFAHDDHVMADVMLTFAGLYCQPFDLSQVATIGASRRMPSLAPDSFRSQFVSPHRIFHS